MDLIIEDINLFREVVKNRDFYLMLKSPIIFSSKKINVISVIFKDSLDELTTAFLEIVIKKGRESFLPEIAASFVSQYKDLKQISTIRLTTASQLTAASVEAIRKKLQESSAINENIEIVSEIDPDIIGGFIAEMDDRIYDASVANKLEKLKKEFKENLYISQIIAK